MTRRHLSALAAASFVVASSPVAAFGQAPPPSAPAAPAAPSAPPAAPAAPPALPNLAPPAPQPPPGPAPRVAQPVPFPQPMPYAPQAPAPYPPPQAPAAEWGTTPPPEPAPEPLPGVTAKGLPLAQRGGVVLEASAMLFPKVPASIADIDVIARIPILPHTFIDADLPIGAVILGQGGSGFAGGGAAIGNAMVGVHHVFRPAERVWLTLGGAFGFPLLNKMGFETAALGKGLWDLQMYADQRVPFAMRMGLEAHAGVFEFRAELDPVWALSIDSDAVAQATGVDNSEVFALLHAVEIQAGHTIGGGLRYQGVVVPTDNPSFATDKDKYQGVFEPFFRVYKDPVFFRLGVTMPVDTPLGQAFNKAWGVRFATGFSID